MARRARYLKACVLTQPQLAAEQGPSVDDTTQSQDQTAVPVAAAPPPEPFMADFFSQVRVGRCLLKMPSRARGRSKKCATPLLLSRRRSTCNAFTSLSVFPRSTSFLVVSFFGLLTECVHCSVAQKHKDLLVEVSPERRERASPLSLLSSSFFSSTQAFFLSFLLYI